MKILFIFNHRAGTGINAATFSETVDTLISNGHSVRYVPSYELRIEGAITKEEFLGCDRILCSGGDGTLSQLVSRLYEMGILSECKIGYIPAGSTNDFAASLSIPTTHPDSLYAAIGDNMAVNDLGLFNKKTFTYVAAFGLFSEVSYNTDQNLKNVLGHSAYIISGAKSLLSIKPYHVRINVDESVIEDDVILCMISNARQVGGFRGFFDKNVSLSDGIFEITIIKHFTGLSELQDLAGLITSQAANDMHNQGLILRLSGSRISVESETDIDWTLDGEFGGSFKKSEITVLNKMINIFKS